MINYNEIAGKVLAWNNIVGDFAPTTNEDILLQTDLCVEEAKETREGIWDRDCNGNTKTPEFDWAEVLDGAVDQFVVLCKLLDQLEDKGIDVNKAFTKVLENNSSKFIPNTKESEGIVTNTVEMYEDRGVNVIFRYSTEGDCFTVKNAATGKLLKPYGFVPVNLSDCVPENLK